MNRAITGLAGPQSRSVLLLSIVTVALTGPTTALAFDCRKASTLTEEAICADPELKRKDNQLSRDYALFRQHFSKSGNYDCLVADEKKRQLDWRKERDACGADKACIAAAYDKRQSELDLFTRACFPMDSMRPECKKGAPTAPVTSPVASAASCKKTNKDGSCACERIDEKNNPKAIEEYNTRNLSISEAGANFIKGKEALVNCMYNDARGYVTVGFGHLIADMGIKDLPKKAPQKFEKYRAGVSDEEADALFRKDVSKEVAGKLVKHVQVKLNQCQMDSLISFIYNYRFYPRLKKAVNSCNWDEVAAAMRAIVTAGGKRLEGLVARREQEVNMFLNCKYPPEQNPARYKCCTYQTHKDTPNIQQGEYKARCKSGCKEGGVCYGV